MTTVRFYSLLRDRLGEGEIEIEAGDVAEAVARLKEIFGSRWSDTVEEGGRIKESYIFLIGGRRISPADFRKTPLNGGEALHIFSPIAGG